MQATRSVYVLTKTVTDTQISFNYIIPSTSYLFNFARRSNNASVSEPSFRAFLSYRARQYEV